MTYQLRPSIFATVSFVIAFIFAIIAAFVSSRIDSSSNQADNKPASPPTTGLVPKSYPLPTGGTITLFVLPGTSPGSGTGSGTATGAPIGSAPTNIALSSKRPITITEASTTGFLIRNGASGLYLSNNNGVATMSRKERQIDRSFIWTYRDRQLYAERSDSHLYLSPDGVMKVSTEGSLKSSTWRLMSLVTMEETATVSHQPPRYMYEHPVSIVLSYDGRRLTTKNDGLGLANADVTTPQSFWYLEALAV